MAKKCRCGYSTIPQRETRGTQYGTAAVMISSRKCRGGTGTTPVCDCWRAYKSCRIRRCWAHIIAEIRNMARSPDCGEAARACEAPQIYKIGTRASDTKEQRQALRDLLREPAGLSANTGTIRYLGASWGGSVAPMPTCSGLPPASAFPPPTTPPSADCRRSSYAGRSAGNTIRGHHDAAWQPVHMHDHTGAARLELFRHGSSVRPGWAILLETADFAAQRAKSVLGHLNRYASRMLGLRLFRTMRHAIRVENILVHLALAALGQALRDRTTFLTVSSVSLLVDSMPGWFTNTNMSGV